MVQAEQRLTSLQTASSVSLSSPTPVAAAMMKSAANVKAKTPSETLLDELLAGVQTNMADQTAEQENAIGKPTVEHGLPDGPLSSLGRNL